MIRPHVLLLVLMSFLSPVTVLAQNYCFLAIGNDDYRYVKKLERAASDARAIGEVLKQPGSKFKEVVVRNNLDRLEMMRAIRALARCSSRGGVGVLFYAGHGVQKGKENLLLPKDIKVEKPADLDDGAVTLGWIMDRLEEMKAKFALVILDACRDNPFPEAAERAIGGTRGLTTTTVPDGLMVIYSAGANQTALDKLGPTDSDPNGLFTREFLKYLRQPGLRVHDMVMPLRDAVRTRADEIGHTQNPAIYDQSSGDVILIEAKEPRPVAQQATHTPDFGDATHEKDRKPVLTPPTPPPPTNVASYDRITVPFLAGFRLAALSSNRQWLAAENNEGQLVVFDLSQSRVERPAGSLKWESTPVMAINSAGSKIAALRGDSVAIHDLASTREPSLLHNKVHGRVNLLEFSPDDSILAVATENGEVTLLPLASSSSGMRIIGSARVDAMAFAPKGHRLAVASVRAAKVEIYEIQGSKASRIGTLSRPSPDPFLPHRLAFDHDGKRLAVGDAQSGTVWIWDWHAQTVVQKFPGAERLIQGLSFDDSGKLLASVGEEGAVRVWDTQAHKVDLWLPQDDGKDFMAVFFGRKLYTTTSTTNQPGLLLWVFNRVGSISGAKCEVLGTQWIQETNQQGACLFPRMTPGTYTARVSHGDRTAEQPFEVKAPVILGVFLPSPAKPW